MARKTRSNAIVVKPNKIIQAGQDMSLFELKVFNASLALLEFNIAQSDAKSSDALIREQAIDTIAKTVYRIPIKPLFENFESMEIYPNSTSAKYVEEKLLVLVNQALKIRYEDGFKAVNIMSSADYKYDSKTVDVKFGQDIVPIFVDMFKDGFTKIRLASMFKFRSPYSMRLYEELLRVKNMKSVMENGHTLKLTELFFMLGLDRDKEYKKYDHFRQRVLLKAKSEISEKGNMEFEFEEIRKGKPVYQIRFYNIVEKDNQPTLQLSLFDDTTGVDFSKSIKLDEQAEEFLESVLESAETKIVKPKMEEAEFAEVIEEPQELKVEQIEIVKETSVDAGEKFTAEQLEKLDKYLADVFSAADVKRDYDFDYIEYYYNKTKELEAKDMVKNFPNFFYDMLKKDKHKFQELKQKQEEAQKAKLAAEKIAKAKAEKAKELEREKKEKEAADIKRRTALFDSLDDSRREKYLEEFYAKNPFHKDVLDKDGISEFTKISIGERVEKEARDRFKNCVNLFRQELYY